MAHVKNCKGCGERTAHSKTYNDDATWVNKCNLCNHESPVISYNTKKKKEKAERHAWLMKMIGEKQENIDELSDETLSSYIKRSVANRDGLKKMNGSKKKLVNRNVGISTAVSKLAEDAMAVNNVSDGKVAGLGQGPQGEPAGKLKKPRRQVGIRTELIRRWLGKK